ncbi:MAG: DUF4189 domain-containing protein [Xanthomonadaceae bacterium]|nr:DUF4189 domain-containing protein [Xanthomonadaceae bacterium]
MRSIGVCLLLCLSLMPFVRVLAEGGICPPGYYPVNSPGVMGCAPMSGGGEVPQVAGPAWVTSWGAISADVPAGAIGTSYSQRSKRKANSAALADCRAKGGSKKNCSVLITFYNQCGAIAAGDNNGATFRAPTPEEASRHALKNCTDLTSNCKVMQTVCSYPMRVD